MRPQSSSTNLKTLFLALMLVTASNCLAQQPRHSQENHWVGTWSASAQAIDPGTMPPPPGLADTTLRQTVRVSLGGNQLRLRFSNAFAPHGTASLKINEVRIATSAGGSAIKPATDTTVTFRGEKSVTISHGAVVVSDPVNFELAPLSNLTVTMHLNDTAKDLTGHRSARGHVYLQTGNAVSATELPAAATATVWYYLSGIDVLQPRQSAAVAVLGDSITDGKGSTNDANRRWTDFLANRLQANPQISHIGVLNQGIGGNNVIRGGLGQPGLARLERDVLAQPGVRWLIVQLGINDLGGKKTTAEEIIAGYEQIILRARDRDLLVYGATIMPCGGSGYFSPELETARIKVNDWIRTSGTFDAVIDMDAATRDLQDPTRLKPTADSGDHLHLNDEGYKMMAEVVDLSLFRRF